jgi:glycosyltransferase involved in cell wall biosynthesis
VIALSRTHWDQLNRYQVLHRKPPFIVPNGVLPPKLDLGAPPRPDGPVRIAFMGRLVEHKGVQVAIDARIGLRDRAWTLDVYGDGPYRGHLAAAIPAGLRDRIRLRGWVADPADALRDADLLVLPSRLEALPLSLLEAMWAGKPVLANAVGAVPELLADDAGVLVSGMDAASWTNALRDVLDHPDRLTDIARRGHERVATAYTVEAMIDGYEHVLAECQAR